MKEDIFYTEDEGFGLAKKQWRTFISCLTFPLLFHNMWLTYNWWANSHYWENRKLLLNLLREGRYKIKNVNKNSIYYHKSIDIQFEGSDTVYNIWLYGRERNLTLSNNIHRDIIGLFMISPIEYYRTKRCWKLLDECTNNIVEKDD